MDYIKEGMKTITSELSLPLQTRLTTSTPDVNPNVGPGPQSIVPTNINPDNDPRFQSIINPSNNLSSSPAIDSNELSLTLQTRPIPGTADSNPNVAQDPQSIVPTSIHPNNDPPFQSIVNLSNNLSSSPAIDSNELSLTSQTRPTTPESIVTTSMNPNIDPDLGSIVHSSSSSDIESNTMTQVAQDTATLTPLPSTIKTLYDLWIANVQAPHVLAPFKNLQRESVIAWMENIGFMVDSFLDKRLKCPFVNSPSRTHGTMGISNKSHHVKRYHVNISDAENHALHPKL
ncbi:MAG: hypothetical protein Q9209_007859, partial [Squamulea sp. 1 TL-2023]